MDHEAVNYKKPRFTEILNEAKSFLKKAGFKKKNIQFVPYSGFTGENLSAKSEKLDWYKGPTILGAIDNLDSPTRPDDKPLRLPLQDVYKISGVGTVPVGRVETGILKAGMQVKFSPSDVITEVKSVEMHHEVLEQANPGDNVGFNVKNVSVKDVKRGYVVSDNKRSPAKCCKSF